MHRDPLRRCERLASAVAVLPMCYLALDRPYRANEGTGRKHLYRKGLSW
jgi:hypothetical protein